MKQSEVTKEDISNFLNGSNPMERIIKIEGDYNNDKIYVLYRNEKGELKTQLDSFYPFVWCKASAARGLFNGDRALLKREMLDNGIRCVGLRTANTDGTIHHRMENGYRIMFKATRPMSYTNFLNFFKKAGRPIYAQPGDINYGMNEYVTVGPTEQYMIYTGKRMFKGYDGYDELLRMQWDLETEGLDPKVNAISQIGIRTNRGFERIITIEGEGEEKIRNEINAIGEALAIMKEIAPDVIAGHNTENFDWNFIDVRLQNVGSSLQKFTKNLFYGRGIYKSAKETVLKLGGEVEYFHPTVMWGHNITDSLFAVRRAQALDSNMKQATLKYATKYAKLVKPNRVYVPGKMINDIWLDKSKTYAFNDENGHWFKVDEHSMSRVFTDENGNETKRYTIIGNYKKIIDNETKEEFAFTTGRYIVERYLLDDLWETDKVENRYNETNFLISKLIPISFEKACVTGTAALWKYIMLAWSYEHNLGIPELTPSRRFTGGLSRLIKVGFIGEQYKLDYNSLYPSIILSWGIESEVDVMNAMTTMLDYVLTEREKSKGLKSKWGKEAKNLREKLDTLQCGTKEYEETENECIKAESNSQRFDRDQAQKKVLGNSFFGAYGSGSSSGFNWSDVNSAEQTTCTGRQLLRLMISHFKGLGYDPIVGDSFTGDTPLFIKYNDNNLIDIKTISELISTNDIELDILGREYDTSKKNFKVLCRSGWIEPIYIYRHKTNKPIYNVSDNNVNVEITEDHSLFENKQEKIKPSEVNENTELEYYSNNNIFKDFNMLDKNDEVGNSILWLLNANIGIKKNFIKNVNIDSFVKNKKTKAIILYIQECIKNS